MDVIFVIIIVTCVLLILSFTTLLVIYTLYSYRQRIIFKPAKHTLNIIDGDWHTFNGLSGYLIPGKNKDNIVIYSHGSGVNLSFYKDYAQLLTEFGDVFIYDYPGYGKSKGNPNHNNVLKSGLLAYDYIKNMPYKNIYLYGFSLGCTVSAYIASKRDCQGLILEGSYYRLSDTVPLLGRVIIGDYFITKKYLVDLQIPLVFLQSPDDGVIPFNSTICLYNVYKGPKLFIETQGGHNQHDISLDEYNHAFNFLVSPNPSLQPF